MSNACFARTRTPGNAALLSVPEYGCPPPPPSMAGRPAHLAWRGGGGSNHPDLEYHGSKGRDLSVPLLQAAAAGSLRKRTRWRNWVCMEAHCGGPTNKKSGAEVCRDPLVQGEE